MTPSPLDELRKPAMRFVYNKKSSDNGKTWWHHYVVANTMGAVEFQHCHDEMADYHVGGLEIHYANPPEYMDAKKPSHENCHWLGKPCWHDGSSLYAQEEYIPMLKFGETAIFERLVLEHRDRFSASLTDSPEESTK